MTAAPSLSPIRAPALPARAWQRAAVGLGQGLAIWWLYRTGQSHAWPATQPLLLGPLLLGLLFVPVLAVVGLGNLRRRTLVSWLLCAFLVLAVVGAHDLTRNRTPAVEPTIGVVIAIAFALFIAHTLVTAADIDRRPVAAYPTYFEAAWKHALQLMLALLFLAFFWGVFWLAAEMFATIDIQSAGSLLRHPGFAMPASALAFAFALHLADIRGGPIQGARSSLLLLLSWLLPLAAVLIIAFLASLPFTGLAPLWRTSHGSEIVLSAAAVLVVLINIVYRDGGDGARPAPLRWAGSTAALCLPLLVAISAYGLALRVGQHGWSSYRIVAAAALVVAGCYAAGYAWAAIASRAWLQLLETANIVAACAILATTAALTTPFADPARLSVADQVRRLESGRVSPDQFDFTYLRFRSGRYGPAALERLEVGAGPYAGAIKRHAERALALRSSDRPTPPASAAQLAGMAVFPAGEKFPQALARRNWNAEPAHYLLPACLFNADVACEAYVTHDGGRTRVVIADLTGSRHGIVLQQDGAGAWRAIGILPGAIGCENVRQALRAGRYTWQPTLQEDIEAAGQRLAVTPLPMDSPPPNCR